MPQDYKRKSRRGSAADVLKRAEEAVKGGQSIRAAAGNFNVDRMTLTRYIAKRQGNPQAITGYANCTLRNMIFTQHMENELAAHIKELATSYHGLTKDKCRKLAYEYAIRNNLDIPENWRNKKKAGEAFWLGFKKRQKLAIRSPEATSLARATAFNRHTAGQFYTNLATVMDRYHFQAQDIYNVDETGCTTVQKPSSVVAQKGIKQVGSMTSAERGELLTVVNTINASGAVLPPMLIFPRVNYRDHFIRGAPTGSKGAATRSGWMNEELFIEYLDHFIEQTRCSVERKVLLIMDNHESHASLEVVDKARANGVILLTIPPHTSHRLQPLDKAVYGPYKKAYGRAMDAWMRVHPGKTITIYEIPALVNEAHMSACVPRNIIAGFQSTGIFPYNADIFTDADYAPASVTDREEPPGLPATDLEPQGTTDVEPQATTDVEPQATTDAEPQATTHVEPQGTTDAEPQATTHVEPQGTTDADPQATTHVEPQATINVGPRETADITDVELQTSGAVNQLTVNQNDDSAPATLVSSGYISPRDILPLPKAMPRKRKANRRRGSTKILTDTPVRDGIAEALFSRKKQKQTHPTETSAKKNLFTKKSSTTIPNQPSSESSSSSESDTDIEQLCDDSEEGDSDTDIMEGDFVIIKVPGKARILHYVARVDVLHGDEFEEVFLRRMLGLHNESTGPMTFVIDTEDEAMWSREDIAKKLPTPTLVGTSRRTQLQFHCKLDSWNLK